MQQESRVKKSLLNARVNLIFYFLTLVLSFFSRKIFLDSLGADFVGLTATLQNLLGFLNLAELGISTAIGYVLYKPLFDHDENKINEIISVFGYIYRWIGFIILGAGLILGIFLPLIFSDTIFNFGLIYFAYFSFLVSSLIGYFINYRQTLLGADQRNYVVTTYFQSVTIIKMLIQMALAYYTGSYYIWLAIELTFGIIYSFILNWKINKVYPWLKSEIKLGKQLFKQYPEVIKYTKQLFVHKLGGFVQFQISPILVFSFVSLKIVAYYNNYTIIVDKITILFNNMLGGIFASVGNLIAEGNRNKIISVYWELVAVRFFLAGTMAFCLYQLVEPFIAFWIGKEYILDHTVLILILINMFITLTRASEPFLYGYGIYSDILSPIIEIIIYVSIAIIAGHQYGLPGIISAGILSQIIIGYIWKPYFLYKKGFKETCLNYIKIWPAYLLCTIAAIISSNWVINAINIEYTKITIWGLLKIGIISLIIFAVIDVTLLILFTEGMKTFVKRMKKYIYDKLQERS